MKRNYLLSVFCLIASLKAYTQEGKKDTTLTWLDDIDVTLLNSEGSKIGFNEAKSNNDRYSIAESQNNAAITNAQHQIDDANSKMLQYSNSPDPDKYNEAAQAKYNAEYAKEHAEWNQQEDQTMANIYNMSMQSIRESQQAQAAAKAKEVELGRQAYLLGDWAACVTNFESAFKISNGIYAVNTNVTSADWCLLARAGKRAIEKSQQLNLKQNPYEWNFASYTNALAGIDATLLTPFQKMQFTDETLKWFPQMFKNLPADSKAKYSKWFLDVFYGFLSQHEGLIRMSKLPELIEGISKCAIASNNPKFYDDFIYALEHEGTFNYMGQSDPVKTDWKIPKTGSGSGYRCSTDILFLTAAYYQETKGNKAQALEVWQNYLDFANFNIQHKALALYYGLALQKTQKLKTEVGANALPHVNHNWGIKKSELDKKTEDKKKDEQRTKSGLNWDDDEKK